MILEHALLNVLPTRTEEFEAAFGRASSIISTMPGFVSLRLSRGIECPDVYLLLVEWETLEDHTEGFRGSDEYKQWKALLHHFYDPFPVVEHFAPVGDYDDPRTDEAICSFSAPTPKETFMNAAASSYISKQDQLDISTYTWATSVEPARGVVQIAHGLAEYGSRYARFAAALNAAGFHVVASDHRGHGASITETPGDFGPVGFAALWADIEQLGEKLLNDYPDLPLFLFAHSMGSFAAQHVLIERSDLYAGVVLSGSTTLDVLAAGMVDAPAGDLSVFNSAFEHRTGYEWLSRDEAEVDAYVADELCGFDLPETTVPALFTEADKLADPHQLGEIRSDLPLLIASGSDDPLAGGGQLIEQLASRYREAGMSDVTVKIYQGARHEIVNETNRDEVTADIIGWLTDRLT